MFNPYVHIDRELFLLRQQIAWCEKNWCLTTPVPYKCFASILEIALDGEYVHQIYLTRKRIRMQELYPSVARIPRPLGRG